MAVPKRKTSKHRQGIRRSHHAIGKPTLRPCANCKAYGISHRVCPECGFYKGVQVFQVKTKISKKREKKQSSNTENSP